MLHLRSLAVLSLLMISCGTPPNATTPSSGPNVLLITLDTTRADSLGCYGNQAAKTPSLDQLATTGVLFEQAFTSVPLTQASHASLFTGTYPPTHGIRVNGVATIGTSLPTLAETFSEHDYRTGAFVAAWVLDSTIGLDRGFSHYDDHLVDPSGAEAGRNERPADEVSDAALAWLTKRPDVQFFAWLHFFDPHHPYEPPPPFKEQFPEPYDGEISFMDSQIGRVLAWLDQEGLREKTLIVVAGDHGEAFFEHKERQHGLYVYDTTMHVPLIMAGLNGLPKGVRVPSVVRLVDVFPTIIDILGWEVPKGLEGISLVPAWRYEDIPALVAYGESLFPLSGFGWAPLYSITTERWKYIAAPRPELYDRQADPGEVTEVSQAYPDVVDRLRCRLAEIQRRMPQRGGTEPALLDTGARKRLESLGYVAGGMTKVSETDDTARRDPKDMAMVFRSFMKAKSLAQKERHEDVVTLLEPLIRQSPESGEFYRTLGNAYLGLGRNKSAQTAFTTAINSLPSDPDLMRGLGDALRVQGDISGAQKAYLEALALNPEDGQIHSRLGLIYAQRKDFERASIHFRRFVEAEPHSPNALANLGNVLIPLGQTQEAAVVLRRALILDPGYPSAHRVLWMALLRSGRHAEAIAALREARHQLPGDRNLDSKLAWLLATSRDPTVRAPAEAVHLASGSAMATPASAEIADVLAAAYAAHGNFPMAVDRARVALTLAEDQGLSNLHAQILERLALYQAGKPYVE
jgi:arylsulfatase A-like enzyme/Flp pilus assembly protein TadD